MTRSAEPGRAGRGPPPWPCRGRVGAADQVVGALGASQRRARPSRSAHRGVAARSRSTISPPARASQSGSTTRNSSPPKRTIVSSPRSSRVPGDRALAQHLVAGEVAVGVVVGLEAVDVDDRQAEGWLPRGARAISRGSCSSSARRLGSPVRASLRARPSTSPSSSSRSASTRFSSVMSVGAGVDQLLVGGERRARAQPVPAAVLGPVRGSRSRPSVALEDARRLGAARSRSSGWVRSSAGGRQSSAV